jgi:transcriptional regulator NrdR family protein
MKCQVCGAKSIVKEARETGVRYRRRRECKNGHYFTTEEVVVSPYRMQDERIERTNIMRNKKLQKNEANEKL